MTYNYPFHSGSDYRILWHYSVRILIVVYGHHVCIVATVRICLYTYCVDRMCWSLAGFPHF